VLVARTRLALALLVWLIPVLDWLSRPREKETYVGIAAASVGVAIAYGAYRLSRRLYRPWVGLATSLMDVTLISLALAAFLLIGQPHTTVNSRVVFEIYLLSLAATALRFDPRICMITGAVAMAQYLGLVLYTTSRWNLNDPQYAPYAYGTFNWGDQISRLILMGIGAVISAGIVRRTRRLQWLSARDRLTGLLNRSMFDDLLLDEASRARRTARPLSVVMIDIDHFKIINDTYGHLVGDDVIRLVADTIRRVVRQRETVARYGGDEFVLLFPETPPAIAIARAEAIRAAVAETPVFQGGAAPTQHLTVSIGVASLPADGLEGDEVLAQADARLLEAKQAGRNMVLGYPADADFPAPAVPASLRH
jgi:diguanylate cyclase (GGDEF)-like protein